MTTSDPMTAIGDYMTRKIKKFTRAPTLTRFWAHQRQPDMSKVAESCFSFLHMEVVNTLLSPTPTAEELQHAGRRLEVIGYQVGERLAERYTKDRPRFADTLEIIKFICKDFWYEIYGKQIDKLQTNNRVRARCACPAAASRPALHDHARRCLCPRLQGVYMLQDNRHRLLVRCSPAAERQSTAKQMGATYGKFPCGLIRGALCGLGVSSSVGVEMTDVSACQFTVRIQMPQPPQPPTPQQDTSRE